MHINRFFNTLIRMLWLIVLLGMVGGGCSAYLNIAKYNPVYKAETTIYGSIVEGDTGIKYENVLLSRQLVQESQDIITSDKVLEIASDKLKKYNLSSAQLKAMISVSARSDSSVITISSTSNDPHIAAEVSTEVAQAFISQLDKITNSRIVGVLNDAKVPQSPIRENIVKNIIIGIIAGMVIAVVIIYIKELFDTTVRYTEDIEHTINIKVIGVIPKYGVK